MELINTPEQHLNLRAADDLYFIQKAVAGDNTAFSILFERYRASVHHFIAHRTSNEADAQDLTLEAFGKAFLKLDTFVPIHAFSTWLFRIAHNNFIDFARRQRLAKMSTTTIEVDTLSEVPQDSFNPEEEMIRNERIAMVFSLVQQLDPRYRRMIELRFYEELSYEAIAAQLDLPIGTVKAQLFRAKELLRGLLESPRAKA